MIASTPVSLSRLAPDDWERWDRIWETHAKPLTKGGVSPNAMTGAWTGFDIFAPSYFKPVYQAPLVDLESLYPSLHRDVWKELPEGIVGIRFAQSHGPFPAHADNFAPSWQLRCLFKCDNPSDHWYYTRLDNTDRRALELPKMTNWFAYLDGRLKHGTTYHSDRPKILLQVFGKNGAFDELIADSINTFHPRYHIDYRDAND